MVLEGIMQIRCSMNEKEKLIRDPTPKKRNNFRLSSISEYNKMWKKKSLGSHLAFFNSRKMDWYNEKKKKIWRQFPLRTS